MDNANSLSFRFETRCFAPFDKFGGGFDGDDRGYSVSGDGTSRIRATVDLDPRNGTATGLKVDSDVTRGPKEFVGPIGKGYAKSDATVSIDQKELGAQYDIHVFGSNPLIAGAPNIDFRSQIEITQLGNFITIHAAFYGDKFPATEAVLRDVSGNGIFLGGFMPTSKSDVFTNLPGNAERPTGTLGMTVGLDRNGNFSRIMSAEFTGPNGRVGNKLDFSSTFTIDGWNRAAMQILTPEGMPAAERIESRERNGIKEKTRQTPSHGHEGMGL